MKLIRAFCACGVLVTLSPEGFAPSKAVAATSKPGEVAAFAEAVVRSLGSASDARKALAEAETKDSPAATSLNAMTAHRRAIAKLRFADSLLEPYSHSRRQMVSETTAGTRKIYAVLVTAFEGGLRLQASLVDMKPGDPLGPILSEASKYTALAEQAWKDLPVAATAGLTYALVDTDRTTADGRVGFLLITERERADLLKTIEVLFGERVASGKHAAGLFAPEGSASLLARFLRQPWRTSDQK